MLLFSLILYRQQRERNCHNRSRHFPLLLQSLKSQFLLIQNPPPHLDLHPLMKERLLLTRCQYKSVPVVLPILFNCLLYVFALQSIYLSSKDGTSDDGIVCICPTRPLFAYLESHHCTYQPSHSLGKSF